MPYAQGDCISYAIKVLHNVEELSTCHAEHIWQIGRNEVTRFMMMSTIEVHTNYARAARSPSS